jgi:hypothetical protein
MVPQTRVTSPLADGLQWEDLSQHLLPPTLAAPDLMSVHTYLQPGEA